MDFPLEHAYGEFARFAYTSLDRIVVKGRVGIVQRPGGLVTWARDLIPDRPITDSWLGSLARRFHKRLEKFAAERGIPIVHAPRGGRKDDVARAYRSRFAGGSGVYLILRGREKAKVFQSRKLRNVSDPLYRALSCRDGFVDQYYFYLVDKYWGPMSIKLSSHLPFDATVFLNGNRWLAEEAGHRGLTVSTKDNSIVRCGDPRALQQTSDSPYIPHFDEAP